MFTTADTGEKETAHPRSNRTGPASKRAMGIVKTPETILTLRYLGFSAAKRHVLVKTNAIPVSGSDATINDEENELPVAPITITANPMMTRTCRSLFPFWVRNLMDRR